LRPGSQHENARAAVVEHDFLAPSAIPAGRVHEAIGQDEQKSGSNRDEAPSAESSHADWPFKPGVIADAA
jgi:hypothetical protein